MGFFYFTNYVFWFNFSRILNSSNQIRAKCRQVKVNSHKSGGGSGRKRTAGADIRSKINYNFMLFNSSIFFYSLY
jgi:hypothetical protein